MGGHEVEAYWREYLATLPENSPVRGAGYEAWAFGDGPEMADELKSVTGMVRDRGNCDVVIDFSAVDIVTSSSLSKLLKLRKLLGDCGHRLVFCSVAAATRGIFTVTGLEGIFELADDKFIALAGLQMVS